MKTGCFFLDACIILAEIFEEPINKSSLEVMNQDISREKIVCHASSSVAQECESKLRDLIDFQGETLHELMLKLMKLKMDEAKSKGQHEISPLIIDSDILISEDFFIKKFNQVSLDSSLSESQKEDRRSRLRIISAWINDYMRAKRKTTSVLPVVELFADLGEELQKSARNYRNRLDMKVKAIRIELVIPDVPTVDSFKKLGIPEKDSANLASALTFQFNRDLWVIFVSIDYKHIIQNRGQIWSNCRLNCSDPRFAFFHLQSLVSTYKQPIEFFRSVSY